MSLTSGFFDSFNEDRKYNSLQFSSIFDGIISDGIYATYGDYFLVSPVSGMNIKVGTGRAWLDHTWTLNDADYPLTVEDAEVVLKRIDTVIIEVDRSNSGRINRLRILKGTPASAPVAPQLTKTESLKQYPLADILVKPNATEIVAADITNRIGTKDLPWVSGIIDHVSAEELVQQWRIEFDTLLDTLQTMISQAGQQTIMDNSVGASAIIKTGSNAVTAATVKAIPDEPGAVIASHLSSDITYTTIGLTSNQVRTIRVGTGDPSGGSDGDIYLKITN